MGTLLTSAQGAVDEAAILAGFSREGLRTARWSNGPGDVYPRHEHGYEKVLFCLAGSITFHFDGGEAIELAPGDRLDIEPHTAHAATVGARGVTCIEAAR